MPHRQTIVVQLKKNEKKNEFSPNQIVSSESKEKKIKRGDNAMADEMRWKIVTVDVEYLGIDF